MSKEKEFSSLKLFLSLFIILPGLLGLILFPLLTISYLFNLGIHPQEPDLKNYVGIIWMFLCTFILYGLFIRKLKKKSKK